MSLVKFLPDRRVVPGESPSDSEHSLEGPCRREERKDGDLLSLPDPFPSVTLPEMDPPSTLSRRLCDWGYTLGRGLPVLTGVERDTLVPTWDSLRLKPTDSYR